MYCNDMKYIVGNWKMNLGIRESIALTREILRALRGKDFAPSVVLCPSFTALGEVSKILARTRVSLGAQNCGPEKQGSFTGEVSVGMLEDVGSQYVIIGHSEQRALGDTDEIVNSRLKTAFNSKLTPILCVGESAEVRDAGGAYEFIEYQIKNALQGIKSLRSKKIMVAYEPIWAIGTGNYATVGDTVEAHAKIRELVTQITGAKDENISVLYGGSVNGKNAYSFLRESEIDGVLVGGASIKLKSFKEIIEAGCEVISAQSV